MVSDEQSGDGAAPGSGARPGVSWLHAHGLEVVLALPLVTYLLVLTATPIVETVRLSLDRLHAAIAEAARRKGAAYPPSR